MLKLCESNLVTSSIKYCACCIEYMREYSGLDCLGKVRWMGEGGLELIPSPSIKYVLTVSSFAKEKKGSDTAA